MSLHTILVSDSNAAIALQIEALLNTQPELEFMGRVSTNDAKEKIPEFGAKVIWLDLGNDPSSSFDVLSSLKQSFPKLYYLTSNTQMDPELLKRSMQLGAVDYLDSESWDRQLPEAVGRIMKKEAATPAPTPVAPIARPPLPPPETRQVSNPLRTKVAQVDSASGNTTTIIAAVIVALVILVVYLMMKH